MHHSEKPRWSNFKISYENVPNLKMRLENKFSCSLFSPLIACLKNKNLKRGFIGDFNMNHYEKTQMERFKNAYENKVNLELGWKISVLYSCSTKVENLGLRNVDLDRP